MSVVDVQRSVPDSRIPVEHRWRGLDRRSLLPAAVVVVIGLVLGVLLPFADRSTPEPEVVRAGDRLNLGRGLTVAPPEGWRVVKGIKAGTPTTAPVPAMGTALVTYGAVTAAVHVAPYRGTAWQLLDQVNGNEYRSAQWPGFRVTGDPKHVTATGDVSGMLENFTATSGAGLVAAYALPGGRGLTIAVSTNATGQLPTPTDQIERMLTSVALTAEGARP